MLTRCTDHLAVSGVTPKIDCAGICWDQSLYCRTRGSRSWNPVRSPTLHKCDCLRNLVNYGHFFRAARWARSLFEERGIKEIGELILLVCIRSRLLSRCDFKRTTTESWPLPGVADLFFRLHLQMLNYFLLRWLALFRASPLFPEVNKRRIWTRILHREETTAQNLAYAV